MFGFEVIEIENLVLKMLNTAADHDTVPSDIESIEIMTGLLDPISVNTSMGRDQSYGPQGTEAHNKQSSSKSKGVEAPEIADQSQRSWSSYGDHEVDLL
ncbi:hypothetical protein F2Q68_00039002 [Brassica cretica]|uniref:Uncharacterized protein n=1 Tax=Brassica cretica TaxID=69181 RepID=A0A8S9MA61_BRACR|nr:hypothetical protein F2Q68_00039002 [Brassica cretica]